MVPVGASRGMKKLLQEKFPNMGRLQDISELLAAGAGLSDSEAEPDGEHNITELPQAVAGRGNMQAQQSAVRLTEVGAGGSGGLGGAPHTHIQPRLGADPPLPTPRPADRAPHDAAACQNPGGRRGRQRAVSQLR